MLVKKPSRKIAWGAVFKGFYCPFSMILNFSCCFNFSFTLNLNESSISNSNISVLTYDNLIIKWRFMGNSLLQQL